VIVVAVERAVTIAVPPVEVATNVAASKWPIGVLRVRAPRAVASPPLCRTPEVDLG
jgi:hypothetical protein